MNRYYRPSAPRYTSQFVEDQYPTDLIMQAGAMKYQNKQKMAGDIAEFSAMANVLPAGNRTQEMAPVVRGNWDKRINDTINKYSSNYDSPQAMMEFTKLKQEWQRDPDVQLMKYDYEVGNKEWEDIRKSPTYAMDKKGNNINPSTGYLKQFRPGDQYKGYDPVTKYAAWDEKAISELKTIEPQKRSGYKEEAYLDPYNRPGVRKITTDVEVRDPKMIMEKVQSMATNVINRSTPEGSYLYEDLKEKLGRPPKLEDAMNVYVPLAKSAMVANETSRTSTDLVDLTKGTGIKGMANGDGTLTLSTGIIPKQNESNMPTRQNLRGAWLSNLSNDPNEWDHKTRILDNVLSKRNPQYASLPVSERIKQMKEISSQNNNSTYQLKYGYWGAEGEKLMNGTFAGLMNEEGFLKEEGSKILSRSTIYDLDKGEYIQNVKEKESLTNKGNGLRLLGRVDPDQMAMAPAPGLIIGENIVGGKQKLVAIRMDDLVETDKPLWNLYGPMRNETTGVGDIFATDYSNYAPPVFSDVSDSGTNGDDSNVKTKTSRGTYNVPIRTDDGDLVVNVFKENPSTIDPTNTNSNIFLRQYKLSSFMNQAQKDKTDPISLMQKQMIIDGIKLGNTK